MEFLDATSELGVIVRQPSLKERGIALQSVCEHLGQQPIEINSELISFGFCLGAEDIEGFARFMEQIGLYYVDDYMVLDFPLPGWLSIGVRLNYAVTD
jgi:hypothetical protein